MSNFLPVCKPHFWGSEAAYVLSALESGWVSSKGPYLDEFEEVFAQVVGTRHAIAVTNGTAALHLACEALGLGKGDEVIVPEFVMIAPIFALRYVGAVPVSVDADETWNLRVTEIERAITPRTRAILAVHTYGHPAQIDAIKEIAVRNKLALIEDGAEALGATVNGRNVGSFGDIACFSLYANKVITAGEGGVVVTDDSILAQKIREKRNMCFGADLETQYCHRSVGYNYRLTNIQAALALAQIKYLREATADKIRIAEVYRLGLGDLDNIELPPRSSTLTNVYWVFGILARKARAEIQKYLLAQGIDSRRFFVPLHKQPCLSNILIPGLFPTADRLSECGFYVPSYVGMNDAEIHRVIDAVRGFSS